MPFCRGPYWNYRHWGTLDKCPGDGDKRAAAAAVATDSNEHDEREQPKIYNSAINKYINFRYVMLFVRLAGLLAAAAVVVVIVRFTQPKLYESAFNRMSIRRDN